MLTRRLKTLIERFSQWAMATRTGWLQYQGGHFSTAARLERKNNDRGKKGWGQKTVRWVQSVNICFGVMSKICSCLKLAGQAWTIETKETYSEQSQAKANWGTKEAVERIEVINEALIQFPKQNQTDA